MLREGRGAAARVLTDTELAALFTAIAETRLEGPVLFAVNHGLRESEVIHIRQEAVDLSRGTIWIRHDPSTGWYVKGGVERVVRLNEVTSRWLARHLAEPVQDLCLYLFSLGVGKP
jgi:integrase